MASGRWADGEGRGAVPPERRGTHVGRRRPPRPPTPRPSRPASAPPAATIETVNSQLESMGLQRLHARSDAGRGLKVHASLLALTCANAA